MQAKTHCRMLLLFCILVPSAFALKPKIAEHAGASSVSPHKHLAPPPLLNSSEGLSVIGAALESRGGAHSKPDCSHLVHAIFERAGFPYSYVSSSDLYRGVPEFRHVLHPQPGDLVAWPGHVGIVVNPAQNTFFSSLRSGLGVEAYSTPYWNERGQHRFYRYVKSAVLAGSGRPRNLTPRRSHPTTIPAASHSPSASPI
jgi:hypothetical protein